MVRTMHYTNIAFGTTNYANSLLISWKAVPTIHLVAVLDKNAKKCKKNGMSLKVLQCFFKVYSA